MSEAGGIEVVGVADAGQRAVPDFVHPCEAIGVGGGGVD